MAPPDSALAVALPHPAAAPVPVRAPSAPARPRRDVARIMADLHAAHGTELLRFCRWMLKDGEDAADALQDTWIRAMTALGEERVAVTALRPWLYAIARNVCLDRLRDRKRRSLTDLDESSAGETPGADDVVALRQEAGAALALVGQLSERQRSALMMRELAGMSVPEIARALGLTPDRAAWAIGDARRALEEARAGADLACEDARARLASGHRGRTLRAHLGRCSACMAHDRRLRAKRVLAPAFVPFLWLKRLALPLFANPASAATLAAVAVSAGVPAPRAGNHAPQGHFPAQGWRAEVPAPGARADGSARVEGKARAETPAPAATPTLGKRAARTATQAPAKTPAPAATPTPAPPATAAQTTDARTPPPSPISVRAAASAAVKTVATKAEAVAAPAAKAVGDTVATTTQNVQDTVTTVLDRIG